MKGLLWSFLYNIDAGKSFWLVIHEMFSIIEMLFFLLIFLLKCPASLCSESDLGVILSEPTVRPLDHWRVEVLDSALNHYEEFTICGRVKNYNFKRSSSSSVWETILASDDAQYLHVFIAIDCEDIYNACTNHYKHYIGKT